MADALWEARETLADNLRYLMEHSLDPELKTPEGIDRRCGVSYRTIRRMLRPSPGVPIQGLEAIVPVAAAFNLKAWQLLKPREGQSTKLLQGSEPRADAAKVTLGIKEVRADKRVKK